MIITNKTKIDILSTLVEKVFEDIHLHIDGKPIDNLIIESATPKLEVVQVSHESCSFLIQFYTIRKTKTSTNYHWRLYGSFVEFPMGGGVIKLPQ